MAKFTKMAIMQSFMKLLNTKAFEAITVKDIVDDCGINRNTFYYNFADIYALVDEILQEEINKIVQQHNPYHSWREGLLAAADFALQNKNAILHLHHSVKRPELDKYLQKVIYDVVAAFVEAESQGVAISPEDKALIAEFYTFALVGLLVKWIDHDMKEDFMAMVDRTGVLLDSNVRHAIETIAKKAK